MPVKRPNLLMITVDDMANIDLKYMPNVEKMIAGTGVTFTRGIAPTPICVPARASLLTGQYAINHGARTISGPHGGYKSFDNDKTIATALHDSGYTTLFAGKYLNGYGTHGTSTDVPPGWTQWHATVDPTTYNFFKQTWNVNGKLVNHQGYSSTVITNVAKGELASTHAETSGKPWFQWVNYVAPHFGGPTFKGDPKQLWPGTQAAISVTHPDPRDLGRYKSVKMPQTPSLFPTDTEGFALGSPAKHRFTPTAKQALQIAYERRIEATAGLDREITRLLAPLRADGQLARTLVVIASDNGYSTGYHNFNGKLWHYDEALTIPVMMSGPGVPHGRVVGTPVTNPDIAATLLAAAGVKSQRPLDGLDILPWLGAPDQNRVIPVGGWNEGNGNRRLWWGVTVGPWTYAKLAHTGQVEVFDRAKDPYEMDNLARDPAYSGTVRQLHRLAAAYRACAGNTCPKSMYAATDPLDLSRL
ncbi:MAG: sulfatase-like hydrolase/transferase [Nocardioides sp.]|nr:sulfatase-like hydrolase/transferase [Nocardioides sp.]